MTGALPFLFPDERLDTVNDGIKLIQKKNGLLFGTDALLLAGYMKKLPEARSTAAELGGGTGIISLLCASRNKYSHITVFEIQSSYAELIKRNAGLNSLDDRITVENSDIRGVNPADRLFDAVFTNPPYMKPGTGKTNDSAEKDIARRENCGDIHDFCRSASRLLRFGGVFYAVYTPERLCDLICAMRENGIEPKRLTPVSHSERKAPCLLLAEGKKGGKSGIRITPPLYVKSSSADGRSVESEDYAYIMNTGDFNEKFR